MSTNFRRNLGLLIMAACMLAGAAVGMYVAYTVSVTWRYFGATLVDLKTILGVWILPTLIGIWLGALLGEWVRIRGGWK